MNNALAARYDANTLVTEVSIETCATVDMEPWLSPATWFHWRMWTVSRLRIRMKRI